MDIFEEFQRLDRKGRARLMKQVKAECATYPQYLVKIPMSPFVEKRARDRGDRIPTEIWRSRGFFVQIYDEGPDWERLTVSRNAFTIDLKRFMDGVTWEQLMKLKTECGRGDQEALEIFPAREDEVNVANLRHLWVRKEGSFMLEEGIGWLRSRPASAVGLPTTAPMQDHPSIVPFGVERLQEGQGGFASVLGADKDTNTSTTA